MASSKRSKGARPKSSSSRKVASPAAVSRNAESAPRRLLPSSFVEPALAPLCQLAAQMKVAPAPEPVSESATLQAQAPVSETATLQSEVAPVSEVTPAQAKAPGKAAPSMEEMRRMVAQLAYQRAENIGFGRTNPVEDWLWAEQEVQRRMESRAA